MIENLKRRKKKEPKKRSRKDVLVYFTYLRQRENGFFWGVKKEESRRKNHKYEKYFFDGKIGKLFFIYFLLKDTCIASKKLCCKTPKHILK